MTLLIALPKWLFTTVWTLLFPKSPVRARTWIEEASYKNLPNKPDSWTVYQWMRWLRRRFPGIEWKFIVKDKWVYICITAPAPGFLTGLRDWLGGGTITNAGLVYAVCLS